MLKKNEIIKILTSFFKKKDIITSDDKKFIRYYHIFFRWLKNNHIEAYMKYRKNLLHYNKGFYNLKDSTSREMKIINFQSFLCSLEFSFRWEETKEGHFYWASMSNEWGNYVLKNKKILKLN